MEHFSTFVKRQLQEDRLMTNGPPLRPVVGKTRTVVPPANVVIAYGRFLECRERRRRIAAGEFESLRTRIQARRRSSMARNTSSCARRTKR